MNQEKRVDNYRIHLKNQVAQLEFMCARNTFGDREFEVLTAIERWLFTKGVRMMKFKIDLSDYASQIFLEKASYSKKDLEYIKSLT